MNDIRKGYVGTALGQVHYRNLAPAAAAERRPLVCLHPAPSSGLYFTTVMPLLNEKRRVIAPDYPGYGGSDRVTKPPSIADYAMAMLEVTAELVAGRGVDLLGFHTGCLVAAEMALAAPERTRRLVLCDVPYFAADVRSGLRAKHTQPMPISESIECLAGPWSFNIRSRVPAVALPRAFELFAEQLRAGTHDYFAFEAAFSYDCENRFAELDADVVVIATQSALLDATRDAAAAIANARLVEAQEIMTAVFEAAAKPIARRVLKALDD